MQKPDAVEIEAFVDGLRELPSLGPSEKWWPKYLFHFTDIRNAVSIINSGYFKSRNQLGSGGIPTNIADPKIIGETRPEILDYVRLYFRPLTPMQWVNEGFKPGSLSPHCPVPVVFMFDSKKILTLSESKFSEGNLAAKSPPAMGNSADFLKSMPFDKVYHNSALPPGPHSNKVRFHRQAEVVVPNSIPVTYVKNVWCRSSAEHQTLLNLLPAKTVERLAAQIGIAQKFPLFHRHRVFVETVELSEERAKFSFHRSISSNDLGPFDVKMEFVDLRGVNKETYGWQKLAHNFSNDLGSIPLGTLPFKHHYKVTLYLDSQLAYVGTFDDSAELF